MKCRGEFQIIPCRIPGFFDIEENHWMSGGVTYPVLHPIWKERKGFVKFLLESSTSFKDSMSSWSHYYYCCCWKNVGTAPMCKCLFASISTGSLGSGGWFRTGSDHANQQPPQSNTLRLSRLAVFNHQAPAEVRTQEALHGGGKSLLDGPRNAHRQEIWREGRHLFFRNCSLWGTPPTRHHFRVCTNQTDLD